MQAGLCCSQPLEDRFSHAIPKFVCTYILRRCHKNRIYMTQYRILFDLLNRTEPDFQFTPSKPNMVYMYLHNVCAGDLSVQSMTHHLRNNMQYIYITQNTAIKK